MANGDFLKGLSEGIFGRLGELRKEQEGKDTTRRQETISLISSLADKVEPESLPMLMGHLGDVMGVKGKMKGFWDAFSGMPNRSMEDQLGTKLRDIMGTVTGSNTARVLRDADKAQWMQREGLLSGQAPDEKLYPGATPVGLRNQVILRDPREERLGEIESRYAAQAEVMKQQEVQREANRIANDKRDTLNRRQEEELKQTNRVQKGVEIVATRLAGGKRDNITQEHLDRAINEIAEIEGLRNDYVRASTQNLQAQADMAKIQAMNFKATGGRTFHQQLQANENIAKEIRINEGKYGTEAGIHKLMTTKVEGTLAKIYEKMKNEKAGQKYKFNEAKGTFELLPGQTKSSYLLDEFEDITQKYIEYKSRQAQAGLNMNKLQEAIDKLKVKKNTPVKSQAVKPTKPTRQSDSGVYPTVKLPQVGGSGTIYLVQGLKPGMIYPAPNGIEFKVISSKGNVDDGQEEYNIIRIK